MINTKNSVSARLDFVSEQGAFARRIGAYK